jgi:hypothetical protein
MSSLDLTGIFAEVQVVYLCRGASSILLFRYLVNSIILPIKIRSDHMTRATAICQHDMSDSQHQLRLTVVDALALLPSGEASYSHTGPCSTQSEMYWRSWIL